MTLRASAGETVRFDADAAETWACNGVPAKQITVDRPKAHTAQVSVQGSARWSIGVVDGAP